MLALRRRPARRGARLRRPRNRQLALGARFRLRRAGAAHGRLHPRRGRLGRPPASEPGHGRVRPRPLRNAGDRGRALDLASSAAMAPHRPDGDLRDGRRLLPPGPDRARAAHGSRTTAAGGERAAQPHLERVLGARPVDQRRARRDRRAGLGARRGLGDLPRERRLPRGARAGDDDSAGAAAAVGTRSSSRPSSCSARSARSARCTGPRRGRRSSLRSESAPSSGASWPFGSSPGGLSSWAGRPSSPSRSPPPCSQCRRRRRRPRRRPSSPGSRSTSARRPPDIAKAVGHLAPGPRTTRPGSAPVCSPSRITSVPFTATCRTPDAYRCGSS